MAEVSKLLEKARLAMQQAYAPYSKFQVGVCVKTPHGQLYSGCNVENICYNLGLCAESSAIAAMITAGQQNISEVMIVSSGNEYCYPCGACRQRIREFAVPEVLIYCANASGAYKTFTLDELLPSSFGPDHLANK